MRKHKTSRAVSYCEIHNEQEIRKGSSELKMLLTLPDLFRITKNPDGVNAKWRHNFDRYFFMGNITQDLLLVLFDTLQISSFQNKCIFLNLFQFWHFFWHKYICLLYADKCWVHLHWYYDSFSALNSVFLHVLVSVQKLFSTLIIMQKCFLSSKAAY